MVIQILMAIFGAGGVYAAIRTDIRHLIEKCDMNKRSTERAHERLDEHISTYHRPRD
jgi:hypothetical protein